ncbi:MAG: glucose-1-phosphate thymidylyltransferase [Deltaproteobacteria bacterium]|nr:glucose-1-phosphate thymidylyltransferase [Deltaproteobacteria bacterium]
MPLPRLFSNLPPPFVAFYDPEAPWTLLGDPLTQILGGGSIDPSARIHPSAVIEGPIFVGANAEIRPGAFIRGGVWIGEGCVVGANTEIKRGILLPGASASHLNYVGDSILGAKVGLGAGTILSNHRHDRAHVRIDGRDTGRRKLGAILGDGVLTGCGSVLHPGVVVGCETRIYPGVHLRPGTYAERSIVKLRQELEIVPRA